VAITRARQRLYISHVASRTIFGQTRYLGPSRFLDQLPEEVLERRGLPPWATRVHAAAARARQSDFSDPTPQDEWDQSTPQTTPASGTYATRAGRAPAHTSDGERERVVDYSAFDDVPSDHGAVYSPGSSRPASARGAPSRAAPSRGAPSRAAPVRPGSGRATPSLPARPATGSKPSVSVAGGLPRGTRVFHRRFGAGIVEESEGNDKVVARFKGFGPKKVLLEYLTLKE
jgi:DNA helicase-2/ATP-dependent DNA helicase PcrA